MDNRTGKLAARRAAGQCIRCPVDAINPCATGRTMCRGCLDHMTQRQRDRHNRQSLATQRAQQRQLQADALLRRCRTWLDTEAAADLRNAIDAYFTATAD